MDTTSKLQSTLLLEGIVFTLLGLLVLAKPDLSSVAIELMIGIIILITGVIQVVRAIGLYQINITAWPFLLDGIVAIIIGALLLFYPLAGLKAIISFIVIYFALKAIFEFIAAIVLGINRLSWWLIANSLILALLVIYIWKNWLDISPILLGLLVGINLLSSGIMRIMLGTQDLSLFNSNT